MKKLVLYMVLATLIVSAGEVTMVEKKIEQCNNTAISKVYYIPNSQENYKNGNAITFWNKQDVYIGSTFKVKIYAADKNLLSGCNMSENWSRYSEVAPGNDIAVTTFGSNCIYNKPKDKNSRTLQFFYTTTYANIDNSGDDDAVKTYMIYDKVSKKWKKHTKTYKKYHVTKPIHTHESPCLNVELRYCGDGLVDRKEGEECDPEAKGYSEKNCNVETCRIIENKD